jgi:peptidoglycan/LPS O-acetylase OafA/YrhL
MRSSAIPALTGIRFLAAVYVFIYHYGASALERAAVPTPIRIFFQNGYFGVSAFFVLSGYILTHAHPGQLLRAQALLNYFISRLGRIYPVYVLALLIMAPLAAHELTVRNATAVLLMFQAWGTPYSDNGFAWLFQAWTLSVEMVFYLLFPFLVTAVRRLPTTAIVALLLANIALLVISGSPKIHPDISSDDTSEFPAWILQWPLPLSRAIEFALGVLLCATVQRTVNLEKKVHASWASAAIIAILLSLTVLLSATSYSHIVASATVLIGLLIALFHVSDTAIGRLMGSRWLYVLGSASYSMYLLANPCHGYLTRWLPETFGRLIALPVTILASVIVWRFFEDPARRLITRFRMTNAAELSPDGLAPSPRQAV